MEGSSLISYRVFNFDSVSSRNIHGDLRRKKEKEKEKKGGEKISNLFLTKSLRFIFEGLFSRERRFFSILLRENAIRY